ncbi:hypothetical protein MTO96_048349 [Rhipicephalus appendiculatus]
MERNIGLNMIKKEVRVPIITAGPPRVRLATRVRGGLRIDTSPCTVVVDRGHPPGVCGVLPLAGAEEERREASTI